MSNMEHYAIELCYDIGFTVTQMTEPTEEERIEAAKALIEETSFGMEHHVDIGDLEFSEATAGLDWVECSYGIGFTVTGIHARCKDEAIRKAREKVEGLSLFTEPEVDHGELVFSEVTFLAINGKPDHGRCRYQGTGHVCFKGAASGACPGKRACSHYER